jgi:hypothetical protein
VYWWGSALEHQRKIWVSNRDREFSITPNFTIRLLRGCGYPKNIMRARTSILQPSKPLNGRTTIQNLPVVGGSTRYGKATMWGHRKN